MPLDCLDCVGYDADGNLAAVIDPDSPITCDDDGRLTWLPPSELKPRVYNDSLLLEAPTDNNGLGLVGGQLGLEQRPIAAIETGQDSAAPNATATVHQFGATALMPENPGCHPAIATVTSTVRHKGAAPTGGQEVYFFQQPDLTGGGLAEVWRRQFATRFQWDETHTQTMQTTLPPGAPATTYPIAYEVRSADPVLLERWSVCWQAVVVSIKDC